MKRELVMEGIMLISFTVLLVIGIYLSARKLLLLSVLRPSIRYDSEVWKCIRINSLGGSELKRFLDAPLGLVMRQLEGTWV